MKLVREMENTYMVGTYEPDELDFMIKYLASYGKSIKIIEPIILKQYLRQFYRDLLDHI
ncbi:hypothetical protein [Bacillus litorisediminis]